MYLVIEIQKYNLSLKFTIYANIIAGGDKMDKNKIP